SWGPRAIGDHGAPVSLPKLKKAYEKGTRGISWGPLLTPGPRAVPEFPNGQSAPGWDNAYKVSVECCQRQDYICIPVVEVHCNRKRKLTTGDWVNLSLLEHL
ncbi:unnamed protein product, partial [Staurois parvus]